VDLLTPELERARSLAGAPVPKVIDVRTSIAPDHWHPGSGTKWVAMKQLVKLRGVDLRFTRDGRAYAAPRSGNFRFGLFDGGSVCAQVTVRNIGTPSSPRGTQPCQFGLLWDEITQDVWIDTNRNASFADERAMVDFAVRRDLGTIGRDDPRTIERESVGFTVQTSKEHHAVAILIGKNGHATATAGSAAASRGERGLIEGVAPGAQLVVTDFRPGCIAAMIEAMIGAFRDPRVDIVLLMIEDVLMRPYLEGDGRFPATIIGERLVATSGKPFVMGGGNTFGVRLVHELGNVRWGLLAGAYETKASYLAGFGYLVSNDDNQHRQIGSAGPSGLGGIKPDVVVPSGWLHITTALGAGPTLFNDERHRLRPGYASAGGTSQAAPALAGALALVISAAKQEQVPYDAERLWRAATDSARPLTTLPAYQQGHGAIDIGAMFELLKAYSWTPPNVTIVSRGDVRAPYSSELPVAGEGVGLYESEGWRAGDRAERTILLTRTSGPREPMTFTTSWRGATSTFTSASRVTLPLDVEVPFTVRVSPMSTGVHSGLLTLDHPSVAGHAHRMMTSIVAAESFAPDNAFTMHKSGTQDLAKADPYFMHVPEGTEALLGNRTDIVLLTIDPLKRYRHFLSATPMAIAMPRPGTWEIVARHVSPPELLRDVPAGAPSPRLSYSFDLTAVGAGLEAATPVVLEPGESDTTQVVVNNRFGPFEGGLVSLALGGARTVHKTFSAREQKVFDLIVPEGSPLLLAELTGGTASRQDVDLYLFDCTGKECHFSNVATSLGVLPQVRKIRPTPGLWKVVVDATRAPTGGIAVEYRDLIADPSLGQVTTMDPSTRRLAGARWTATANVRLTKLPRDGRQPHAVFAVAAVVPGGGQMIPVGLRAVPILSRSNTSSR
jgi:subtilisin family serine protease